MGGFNTDLFERAGFTVVTKEKVNYIDPKAAEEYLRSGFKPREEVETEAQFAVEKISLPPCKSVLDIGCGNGVAAVKLSGRGYNVTALDISPVFLEAGKRLEEEQGSAGGRGTITWVHADFFSCECQPHDAALLLDPGLEVASQRFIRKLSQIIKPGGAFFLRYKQGANGTTNWPFTRWECNPSSGSFWLERHTLDRVSGTVHDEWITIDFSNRTVTLERIDDRLVLFSHFVEMMSESGFALTGAWGNVKGAPVTENSRTYALFARSPN
jgi:SAM-dependent methyltransferase